MLGNLFSQHPPTSEPEEKPTPSAAPSSSPLMQALMPATPVAANLQPTAEPTSQPVSQPIDHELEAVSHLDDRAKQVLLHAQDVTQQIQQAHIEPEQLLLGLCFDEAIFQTLDNAGVNVPAFSEELHKKETHGNFTGKPTLSESTKQLFVSAYNQLQKQGRDRITPEDLFKQLLTTNSPLLPQLQAQGIDGAQLAAKPVTSDPVVSPQPAAPITISYCRNLTEEVRAGTSDPVVGRETELTELLRILLLRKKNNPLLIGEPGVGKTALLTGLAQRLVNATVPRQLIGKQLIQLDLPAAVAGTQDKAEFRKRLQTTLNELVGAGPLLLCIDAIETIENEENLGIMSLIMPYLMDNKQQVIGVMQSHGYGMLRTTNASWLTQFYPVVVAEPKQEAAVAMLTALKPAYESFHQVKITDTAIQAAVSLAARYINDRFLPEKAVALLDEAAAQVSSGESSNVTDEHMEQLISQTMGIKREYLTKDTGTLLENLEKQLQQTVIGQADAITTIAETIRRGMSVLQDAPGPLSSFLFLGPSGVGKTTLVNALGTALLGREEAVVSFSMAEFMEKTDVTTLLGNPAGFSIVGQLIKAVRANPFAVLVFDEIEKAHPEFYSILLRILQEGKLTDPEGNVVSFGQTIIICTSRLGTGVFTKRLSEKSAEQLSPLKTAVIEELQKFFRPELLERFDEVVIFTPLDKAAMLEITKQRVKKMSSALEKQSMIIECTDPALNALAEEGYDPVAGSRPLEHIMRQAIENPLATELFHKTFVSGDTIIIEYDSEKHMYRFTKGERKQSHITPANLEDSPQESLPESPIPSDTVLSPDPQIQENQLADSALVKASGTTDTPNADATSSDTELINSAKVLSQPSRLRPLSYTRTISMTSGAPAFVADMPNDPLAPSFMQPVSPSPDLSTGPSFTATASSMPNETSDA